MIDLRQGDCFEILKNIPDGSIDLILTDPPYNVGKDKKWDKIKDYPQWMMKWIKEAERVLRDNGVLLFWHNDYNQNAEIMHLINSETSFIYSSTGMWDKGNFRSIAWKNTSNASTLRSWFNIYEFFTVYIKGNNDPFLNSKTGWERVHLDVNNFSSLRKYAYEMLCFIGGGSKDIERKLGHRRAEHFFYCRPKECL